MCTSEPALVAIFYAVVVAVPTGVLPAVATFLVARAPDPKRGVAMAFLAGAALVFLGWTFIKSYHGLPVRGYVWTGVAALALAAACLSVNALAWAGIARGQGRAARLAAVVSAALLLPAHLLGGLAAWLSAATACDGW